MQKPDSLETPVEQSEAPPQVLFAPPTPLWWRLAILGAIFLIAALGMILQALVSILINAGVSPSVAILLVAGGSAVIGLVLFLMGQNRLDPAELSPDRTLNSLSRDSRMVKETLS